MSLLFVEGFDHQDNTTDLVSTTGSFCWRVVSGLTSIVSPGRFSGKCIEVQNPGHLSGVLTSPLTTAIIGMAMYFLSGAKTYLSFYDSSNGKYQFTVFLDSTNGSITIFTGGYEGTQVYKSANNTFTALAWFYIELEFTINSSTGSLSIDINGVNVISLTNVDLQGSSVTTFDTLQIGEQVNLDNATGDFEFDDIYICDSTTGSGSNPFDSMQGACQVITLFPTGTGADAEFTPSPDTNANWQNVNETAMDSDTTYNYSDTVDNEDLFVCGSLPSGTVPLAVKITMASRQDAAGTRELATHLKSSSTDQAGTSVIQNQTYTYQYDVYPNDPNGSISWTETSVNAIQIGYELTA